MHWSNIKACSYDVKKKFEHYLIINLLLDLLDDIAQE